jgi:pimeloyl-ACP methyl ester carboxylesterase
MMSRLTLSTAAVLAVAGWWKYRHDESVAVDKWRPPPTPNRRIGDLSVRTAGDGDPIVVLLHGLVASGDVFGAAFEALADTHTLVVPDLLGFGRSLDETRTSFNVEDHLDALDEVMAQLDARDRPLVIGAHSMGSALAMTWAARLGPKVQRVVCWGAPVYPGDAAVDAALADTGIMARLFAGNTRLAQLACHANCNHRSLAGWAAAAASPSLPVPIARKASLHTWPAYRDAIERVVSTTDWPDLARTLNERGTTVELIWGENDPIGNRDLARTLTGAQIRIIPGADHHLPLTHPQQCIEQLLGVQLRSS